MAEETVSPICEPLPDPGGSVAYLLPEPGTTISAPMAARLIGVSDVTFYAWVRRGLIPLLAAGQHNRVRLSDLEALVGKTFTVLDLHKASRLHAEDVARHESRRRAKP